MRRLVSFGLVLSLAGCGTANEAQVSARITADVVKAERFEADVVAVCQRARPLLDVAALIPVVEVHAVAMPIQFACNRLVATGPVNIDPSVVAKLVIDVERLRSLIGR